MIDDEIELAYCANKTVYSFAIFETDSPNPRLATSRNNTRRDGALVKAALAT